MRIGSHSLKYALLLAHPIQTYNKYSRVLAQLCVHCSAHRSLHLLLDYTLIHIIAFMRLNSRLCTVEVRAKKVWDRRKKQRDYHEGKSGTNAEDNYEFSHME